MGARGDGRSWRWTLVGMGARGDGLCISHLGAERSQLQHCWHRGQEAGTEEEHAVRHQVKKAGEKERREGP